MAPMDDLKDKLVLIDRLREQESEQFENAISAFDLRNSFYDLWNELPQKFLLWLSAKDSSRDFAEYLSELYDLTIRYRNDQTLIERVAAFDDDLYRPDADRSERQNASKDYRAAVSVAFILQSLNKATTKREQRRSSIAKWLDEQRNQFDSCKRTDLEQFSCDSKNALNVILRGEGTALCEYCKSPVELSRFHHVSCISCYSKLGFEREIKDELEKLWTEIDGVTSMTKRDAMASGRSVDEWIDDAIGLCGNLPRVCEVGGIDLERAAERAFEITEKLIENRKSGSLQLHDWESKTMAIHSSLFAAVLKRNEAKAKNFLFDLLECNLSSEATENWVGTERIGELRKLIGIGPENVFGMGGTFEGELPPDWLKISKRTKSLKGRLESVGGRRSLYDDDLVLATQRRWQHFKAVYREPENAPPTGVRLGTGRHFLSWCGKTGVEDSPESTYELEALKKAFRERHHLKLKLAEIDDETQSAFNFVVSSLKKT